MFNHDVLSLAIDRFEMAATDGKINAEQVISILQSLDYNQLEINKIVAQITSDIDIHQFKQLLNTKDEQKQERLSQTQIRQVEDEFKQAVKFGNAEKVGYYLKKYKGLIDLANKFDLQTRQIPTYEAVQIPDEYAGLEILKLLKEYGADIFYKDHLNQSIIFYICRDGRTLLFDFLIGQGLTANEQDANGQTPLFYAARENRIDILIRLIRHGANVNHRDKLADQTALFYSAKQGQFEACKILVEAGCRISHQDAQKKTAISAARKYGRKECLDLLLQYATKQKEEQLQKREDHNQKNELKRKRPIINLQQKQQYKFMFLDEKGMAKEVTNEDFEKFQQNYPDIAKMILNPDENIDDQMINQIKEEVSWERTAKRILENLRRSKYSIYFNEPVDVVRYGIKDYYDIIKRPMDFGTIKTNINSNKYRCFKEFHNDVMLVFSNCILYNGNYSEVGQAGIKTQAEYLQLLDSNNMKIH